MNYTGQTKRVQFLHQLKATRFISAQRECFDLSETSSAGFWISPLHTPMHGAAEREDEHVADTRGGRWWETVQTPSQTCSWLVWRTLTEPNHCSYRLHGATLWRGSELLRCASGSQTYGSANTTLAINNKKNYILKAAHYWYFTKKNGNGTLRRTKRLK